MNFLKKIGFFIIFGITASSPLQGMGKSLEEIEKTHNEKLSLQCQGSHLLFSKTIVDELQETGRTEIGRISENYMLNLFQFISCSRKILPKEIVYTIACILTRVVLRNAVVYNNYKTENLITFDAPIVSIAFSGDAQTALIQSDGYTMSVWNIALKLPILCLEKTDQPFSSPKFNPDGTTISAESKGETLFWDRKTGKQLYSPDTCEKIVSPDGRTLLKIPHECKKFDIKFPEKTPTLINRITQEHLFTLEDKSLVEAWLFPSLKNNTINVESALFSPNGEILVTVSYFWGNRESTFRVWKVHTGTLLQKFTQPYMILSITFGTDNKTILTGMSGGITRVWNILSGQELLVLRHTNDSHIISALWNPHGRTILTLCKDENLTLHLNSENQQVIHLWDATTKHQLASLKVDPRNPYCLTYNGENEGILIGSPKESCIFLWKIIPCKASQWIVNNTSLLQAWFIAQAAHAKKATGSFTISENSIEQELFKQLPDYVQEYVRQWYSLSVIPKSRQVVESEDIYLDKDTNELTCRIH